MQLQVFYKGLSVESKAVLDSACLGSFMTNGPEAGKATIERIASNSQMWDSSSERAIIKKVAGIIDLNNNDALMASLAMISQNLNELKASKPQVRCDYCNENHQTVNCVKQVRKYANEDQEYTTEEAIFIQNNRQPYDPYSSRYNLGWKDHPNFGWAKNQNATQGGNLDAKYLPPHKQNTDNFQSNPPSYLSNELRRPSLEE